jgi:hypothetical protein
MITDRLEKLFCVVFSPRARNATDTKPTIAPTKHTNSIPAKVLGLMIGHLLGEVETSNLGGYSHPRVIDAADKE